VDVLRAIIYPALDELRDDVEEPAALGDSPDTVLLGPRSALDSLALVSLVVLIEERIEDALGRSIRLVDEDALSQRNSPFRTVGTLAAHVERLVGASAD
jgi:acyl carrier protein